MVVYALHCVAYAFAVVESANSVADMYTGGEVAASCLADSVGCNNPEADDPSLLGLQVKKSGSDRDENISVSMVENVSKDEGISQDWIPSFEHFYEVYGRSYTRGVDNYDHRRNIYEQRRAHAHRHNQHPNRRWTAGVNDYWDWTEAEMRNLHRGHDAADSFAEFARNEDSIGHDTAHVKAGLPKSVLYSGLEASGNIERQGACGACWALASTSVLQYHHEMYQGGNRTFSAQELVSCVPNPDRCGGMGGCTGATIGLAFEWALKHGLSTTDQVPYKAEPGKCTTGDRTSAGSAFGMTGWKKLPSNNYEHVLRTLYENGPIGSSVAAQGWNFYKKGIFDSCDKDAILSHAVVLQGYGIDNSTGDGYWQIQNSWGPSFGENGRIRLLRSNEGEWCGIDEMPQIGSGCNGGPPTVHVCGRCGILFDNAVPLLEGDGSAARKAAAES